MTSNCEKDMDLPVYETFYDGITPYKVYINDDKGYISIYGVTKKISWVDSDGEETDKSDSLSTTHLEHSSLYLDKESRKYHNKLVLKCYFTELFEGKDIVTQCDGNSILIKTMNNSYYYIGDRIYNFTIPNDDVILEFHSPINENNSYPVAIGKKNIYLMLHGVYFDKNVNEFDLDESNFYDTYKKFYYKYNYRSSNTIFKLCDNIKRLDNGYYFQCNDLLEESIIRHSNFKHIDGFMASHNIDNSKFIIDQVKESEKYKNLFYSYYDLSDSDNDLSDSDNDKEEMLDGLTMKPIDTLKDDLEWASQYVASLVLTL